MLESLLALLPVYLFDFWEAFNVVIIVMIFIAMYNMFYPELLSSKLLATIVTATIIFLVVIPFDWFRYLMFVYFFMYAFFWQFQPWTWGRQPSKDEIEKEDKAHQELTHGYPQHGVYD